MIGPVFGWFDRKKRKESRARKKELKGELQAAAELYLEAQLQDEAARVLLLRADAETDVAMRLAFCAQAARIAPATPHGDRALSRKAIISFDLAKASGAARMQGEILAIAAELEACGELRKAAEAFSLAGDGDGEIRVLQEAGLIEQLEEKLAVSSRKARDERDRAQLLRQLSDLDVIAERRKALQLARDWLVMREHDEQVQVHIDRISSKLLEGPLLNLVISEQHVMVALGTTLTIGRAHADIVVSSSAISRQHLRLGREGQVPFVEDLSTRNGTTLGGARVDRLEVTSGLQLLLAAKIPCLIEPFEPTQPQGPLSITVAGERYLAPLGPMTIGDWRLVDAHDGEDRFVVLRTKPGGTPPIMNGYRLAHEIQLCAGDKLQEQRDGPIVLAVAERRGQLT